MDNFAKYLREFITAEAEASREGYKSLLHIIATGGGASLARIMTIPGSSSIVHGMEFPYDSVLAAELIEQHFPGDEKKYMEKAVQPIVACRFAEIASRKSPTGDGIGITAALTTSRHRRGDNHAYIALHTADYHLERLLHITFPKLPESIYTDSVKPWAEQVIHAKRAEEDEAIAKVAIALNTGFGADYFWKLIDSGQLTDVGFNDN